MAEEKDTPKPASPLVGEEVKKQPIVPYDPIFGSPQPKKEPWDP